jgi:Sigma-70 region 2
MRDRSPGSFVVLGVDVMLAQEQEASCATSGTEAVASVPRPAAVSAAVERAYQAHYGDVRRYLLAVTRAPADAEELTAEVFERALRAWDTVPERPRLWLLLTAPRTRAKHGPSSGSGSTRWRRC